MNQTPLKIQVQNDPKGTNSTQFMSFYEWARYKYAWFKKSKSGWNYVNINNKKVWPGMSWRLLIEFTIENVRDVASLYHVLNY